MISQAAPKTLQQLMDESLQKKLDVYIRASERKCTAKIKERAEEIVDSLLLREAQIKTVDKIVRPPIPPKPTRPEIKSTKDTSDIRPLFEEGGGAN